MHQNQNQNQNKNKKNKEEKCLKRKNSGFFISVKIKANFFGRQKMRQW